MLINGGKEFIRCVWKTHVMDINKFQVNDSRYNKELFVLNKWMGSMGDIYGLLVSANKQALYYSQ